MKIQKTASGADLIAGDAAEIVEPVEEWFEVETVSYSKHVPWNGKKRGPFNRSVPSLRVTYNCAGTVRAFTKFICLEHGGHAQAEAGKWWSEASHGQTIPATVDEAIEMMDILKQPARIRVWVNRKNPQIQFIEYDN